MNERRTILNDGGGGVAEGVTLRVTTTDGTTNVGIEMVVTNGTDVYPVTTDSQGKVVLTGLSGGCTIDCETHILSVTWFTATGTMTVDISAYVDTFPVGTVRTYSYSGSYSSVALVPGSYKLQVWGAQGGSNATDSSYGITAQTGGKGGYSEGVLTVSSKQTVRVYVGGQGSSSAGGYNGGGSTTGSSSYSTGTSGQAGYEFGISKMGGGGGATDIRLSGGALLSRMIVAGGGSGGAMCYKKETTSTTAWESFTSGNSSGPETYGTAIYNYFGVKGAKVGDKYRFKCTKNTSGTTTEFIYFIQDSSYQNISSGSWSYGSWVTITIPSNYYQISIQNKNYTGDTSTPPDTFSCTVEHQTTSSSTSTSNESQVGFAGGGTTGGGYSDSYKGKQNAAGSGGSFGQGANQTTTNYRYCSGAGGGGWYGGGGGQKSDTSMSNVCYSGGGSGFVNIAANASYRPSGYTGLQLDSGETIAGSTSIPKTSGSGTETGHAGNGYAKITRLAALRTAVFTLLDEVGMPLAGATITITGSGHTYSITTDSNGEASASVISGTYTVGYKGYSLDTTSVTVTSSSFFVLNVTGLEFTYTGAVQTKTLDAGTYKIECWGAQGGSYSSTYHGGYGGYSVGEITLEEQTTIYVMVGGQGTGGTSSGAKAGGFNGGGLGYSTSTTYIECGGGGASDVRIGQNSLYARVIVAGGGGGAGSYSSSSRYAGGDGGGGAGSKGYQYSTSYMGGNGGGETSRGTSYYGTTANSTTYGVLAVFGTGAGAKSGTTSYQITGGGGGWYGGGYSRRGGGGGGSGYIYTEAKAANYPDGCLLNSSHYLANAQTLGGHNTFPAPSGGTETGHTGNGCVKIKKIS